MDAPEQRHRDFVAGLAPGERLLVALRDELYEGSWERMLEDLRDRLDNRPFIFKLANRIESDVAAIEKMRAYERDGGVNLRDFLPGLDSDLDVGMQESES